MRPLLDRLFASPTASPAVTAPATAPPALHHVDTVVGLRHLAASDGDVAVLAGYHSPGDGGGMLLRWDSTSTAPDDGGLALAGKRTKKRAGRWLQLHDGVVDFRRFGIVDASTPADDALDAMLADPTVHRIEGRTDLSFVRRHVSTRSRVHLDFGGHLVTTEGIEPNTHDNPFGAVLFFTGERTDQTVTHTLTAPMPELVDIVEVGSSASFAVGQWWTVTVNSLTGADERELQLMVEITEVVDAARVRVGYKTGWPFDAGRTFTWTRVEPVRDVTITRMRFEGAGPFDGPDDGSFPDARSLTGSHPVAFELAVRCDVADVHATRTWWPVVMRRWCTHFRTERCSLSNPPTVFYGGAGYLTQQISCLYGHVADCTTSNARHLNDLTASAYCVVKNCHGDGDDAGGNPFTTHGQYEHDLLFEGNSGLMDIANSGAQWGTSATRITVRRHVCSWFVASTKVTDLTLEDVTVVARSTFDPEATLTVNADGVQMRGCTAGFFAIGQRSSRSSRPNVIEDCSFSLRPGTVLVQTPVTAPVHLVRCTVTGLDGTALNGSGPVRLTGCTLTGSPDGAPVTVASSELVLLGSTLRDVGVRLTAGQDQRLVVDGGTTVTGTPGTASPGSEAEGPAFFSRLTGAGPDGSTHDGTVTWQLGGVELTAASATTAHLAVTGGTNHVRAVGTRFTGGRLDLTADGLGDGSSLLLSRCVERGVVRDVVDDGPAAAQPFSLQIA